MTIDDLALWDLKNSGSCFPKVIDLGEVHCGPLRDIADWGTQQPDLAAQMAQMRLLLADVCQQTPCNGNAADPKPARRFLVLHVRSDDSQPSDYAPPSGVPYPVMKVALSLCAVMPVTLTPGLLEELYRVAYGRMKVQLMEALNVYWSRSEDYVAPPQQSTLMCKVDWENGVEVRVPATLSSDNSVALVGKLTALSVGYLSTGSSDMCVEVKSDARLLKRNLGLQEDFFLIDRPWHTELRYQESGVEKAVFDLEIGLLDLNWSHSDTRLLKRLSDVFLNSTNSSETPPAEEGAASTVPPKDKGELDDPEPLPPPPTRGASLAPTSVHAHQQKLEKGAEEDRLSPSSERFCVEQDRRLFLSLGEMRPMQVERAIYCILVEESDSEVQVGYIGTRTDGSDFWALLLRWQCVVLTLRETELHWSHASGLLDSDRIARTLVRTDFQAWIKAFFCFQTLPAELFLRDDKACFLTWQPTTLRAHRDRGMRAGLFCEVSSLAQSARRRHVRAPRTSDPSATTARARSELVRGCPAVTGSGNRVAGRLQGSRIPSVGRTAAVASGPQLLRCGALEP